MIKVTDPQKVVTDPVLLKELLRHQIDAAGVEFSQDYASRSLGKGHSPYAKFYRDLNSNKQFMVVSGLPMVDGDGVKIECGWRVAGINYFSEKNNLFRAKVQGTDVDLIIRNDQPDGRKADDRLSYKPQLFLDGIEQIPGQPSLLPVDPVNSSTCQCHPSQPNHYLENTLEWDYGICKRRLRIIEGSILGGWVFPANPNGEVRIKYNQTGDYRLKLGQFRISDDEEVIPAAVFASATYPFTVSDSATYYPDAHVETTSVDGLVRRDGVDESWATIIAGAGTAAYDAQPDPIFVRFDASATTNKFTFNCRGILLFDTSGLPDAATISSATLSLYGNYKEDYLSATPNINIYSSTPASNTALAPADYSQTGGASPTALCDTPITYANWKTTDPFWNDFNLNAAGIAAIPVSPANACAKFSARNASYDAGASQPPWSHPTYPWSSICPYASEKGNGYKPKLVVTYTVPGWAHIAKVKGVTAAAIAKMNGVAVLAIAKVNGVAV